MQKPRAYYLTISALEIIAIWLFSSLFAIVVFGGSVNTFIGVFIAWCLLLGFTPLINRFFILVPKNSGAVIVNEFRTYERVTSKDKLTKLQPTEALREVGPGIQGILLWEKVGWLIDLGKQVQLNAPITAYSKDNIELNIEWQVILTPLRNYLANLVRHDDDTVRRFFEGRCRSFIIELISSEYAQEAEDHDSIFEKVDDLKTKFGNLFGGSGTIHPDEEEYGAFTNDPQLIGIKRSASFQKSVEALQINKNNAAAIETLKGKGLQPKQALIGTLSAQGIPTDGLIDVTADVKVEGLENLREIHMAGGGFFGSKGTSGSKKDK